MRSCLSLLVWSATIRRVTGFSPVSSSSLRNSASTVAFLRWNGAEATTTIDAQYDTLKDMGFSRGLSETLVQNCEVFAKRFWIVDNSGSMLMLDGHACHVLDPALQIDETGDCTRWKELQGTVSYHAKLAAALGSPTVFRLLNKPKFFTTGPQRFSVAESRKVEKDLQRAQAIIQRVEAKGPTPLSQCVGEIRKEIESMLPQLEEDGTRVSIVIATDGLPTQEAGHDQEAANREFLKALESLQGLPVWIVIRLCTDFEHVVDFYHTLDEKLELKLDVLDDYMAESEEVYQYNKWLNYALAIHRVREMGQYSPLFDLINQRELTLDEIREFCILLFGEAHEHSMPDPLLDLGGFLEEISRLQAREQMPWNPQTGSLTPWIDVDRLARFAKLYI